MYCWWWLDKCWSLDCCLLLVFLSPQKSCGDFLKSKDWKSFPNTYNPTMNYESIIIQLTQVKTPTLEFLKKLKNAFAEEQKMSDLPSNIQLLQKYRSMVKDWIIQSDKHIEEILKKRSIRSKSWIVAVQVLTKPFWCPGNCIFCPNDPTMPKSYIKTEPGAARALLNDFDPYKQVFNRLTSLSLTGHKIDKIELIVLGGTRDVYPQDYKTEFIKWLYDACNVFDQLEIEQKSTDQNQRFAYNLKNLDKVKYSKTLQEAIEINQTAKQRIIGLTLETRPEYVTDENCNLRREMWVTRIEMGVQSLYDDVLEANKRGHTVEQIRQACHKLRQWAFKFSVHVMPGLYKSTYKKDLSTFEKLYDDKFLKPDEIKFYPTSVIPNTELFNLYKKGEYVPLATEEIKTLIEEVLLNVIPPYTRIKRLIRDIPATEIAAWSNVTNLHQLVDEELKTKLQWNKKLAQKFYARLCSWVEWKCDFDTKSERNFVSLDTRSREIKNKTDLNLETNLITRTYESSVWTEYFLSIEDSLGYIYGFTRLLLPSKKSALISVKWLWKEYAMIRELHVYWWMQKLGDIWDVQHTWFGKQLMQKAEEISKTQWYKKLSVISGIGVREYYRKLWYKLEWTYMVKDI